MKLNACKTKTKTIIFPTTGTMHPKSPQLTSDLDILRVIITIYHDFLPPPRRGSHVKSDNTHEIINIYGIPLSSYT